MVYRSKRLWMIWNWRRYKRSKADQTDRVMSVRYGEIRFTFPPASCDIRQESDWASQTPPQPTAALPANNLLQEFKYLPYVFIFFSLFHSVLSLSLPSALLRSSWSHPRRREQSNQPQNDACIPYQRATPRCLFCLFTGSHATRPIAHRSLFLSSLSAALYALVTPWCRSSPSTLLMTAILFHFLLSFLRSSLTTSQSTHLTPVTYRCLKHQLVKKQRPRYALSFIFLFTHVNFLISERLLSPPAKLLLEKLENPNEPYRRICSLAKIGARGSKARILTQVLVSTWIVLSLFETESLKSYRWDRQTSWRKMEGIVRWGEKALRWNGRRGQSQSREREGCRGQFPLCFFF